MGRVIITVEKDRPGYVRRRTDEGRVGQLVLTSYPDGKVTAELLQLTEDSSIDRKVVDRIFAHLTKTITPLSVFASNTANALRSGFRPGRRFW